MTDSNVSFYREASKEATKRTDYTSGVHFGACVGLAFQESKEKPDNPGVQYKMFVTTHKPLSDANDVTSGVGRGIRKYQCLPFWDPAWGDPDSVEGSVVEDGDDEETIRIKNLKRNMGIFARSLHEFMCAHLSDHPDEAFQIPDLPRKNEEGNYEFRGEVIDSDEYRIKTQEAIDAACELAEKMWNEKDPSPIIDRAAYFEYGYETKNGRKSKYPGILKLWPTQPVDYKTGVVRSLVEKVMSVVDEGGESIPTDDVAGTALPAKAAKTNGSKGNGKAVPAKTNGKTTAKPVAKKAGKK